MISNDDNQLICQTGRDTPMGKAMRHFWVPALMTSELSEPDGDPVHVELLGENFVAFRDSNGRVGILDEHCCHRGASLTIGRVENCGIRCIYHGWLFAADGTVLETPNVADPRFKERFKAKSYPVREAGGLVWVYLGVEETPPALPDFPWINADPRLALATCQINGCNYVQFVEGLLDSTHLNILHASSLAAAAGEDLGFVRSTSHLKEDGTPRVEAEDTDYGMHYAAIRLVDGQADTRVTAFASPFWVFHPHGDIWLAAVPMTDEKMAFYGIWYDGQKPYNEEPLRSTQLKLLGFDDAMLEAYGQTRRTFGRPATPTRANGFRQDRAMMRAGHVSGVPTLAFEDSLVCVSAGPLRSRIEEKLSPADAGIAHFYRHLIKTARQVRDGGLPIGLGVSLAGVCGTNIRVDPDTDWRSVVPGNRKASTRDLIEA